MDTNSTSFNKVLIVDDEPTNIFLLEGILSRAGYKNVRSTGDPCKVLELCESFHPDIILLDMHMPGMSGVDVLRQIQPYAASQGYLPVLMLTADSRQEIREECLRSGARDFLCKPFDRSEALQRIKNLLETRRLHRSLVEMNMALEERVRIRTLELEAAQEEIVHRLGTATNLRDDDTGDHVERVGDLCQQIALAIGMGQNEARLIGMAARLHDVGKIGVPDGILLKPGKLSEDEFEKMRLHARLGGEILSGARCELLQVAESIAITHHEKWDGSGYPNRLCGEQIPLAGRICAIADVFDSLISNRPYKLAWSEEAALSEIKNCRGSHFDPHMVDVFLSLPQFVQKAIAA